MHRQLTLLVILLGLAPAALWSSPPISEDPLGAAAYEQVLGKLLIEENRIEEGLAALQRAAELAPGDPYLRAELASLLRRLGRMEAAEEQIRRALSQGPENADLLAVAGEIYLTLGERDAAYLARAEEVFDRLVELRPADLQSLHLLGRIRQRQDNLSGAEEMYRRMLALRPELRTASAALLQVLLEQGKLAEASGVLRGTLDRNAGDLESRLTLSDLLSDQAEHAAAVEVLRAAPGTDRDHPELRRRLAMELYRAGDGEAALGVIDDVVASHPLPRLRLLRALMLAQTGDMEGARDELSALQRDLPSDPEVALALAEVQLRLGHGEDARMTVAELSAQLRQDGEPEKAEEALLELAQLLVADRRWQEALAEVEGLRKATFPAVRVGASLVRAEALLGLERPKEALAELDALGGAGGAVAEARRAQALFGMGRDRQAERVLRQLARRPTERALAAEIYQRAERYDQAIPLLVELLEENPAAVDLRFWLGSAYERTGHFFEAEEVFRGLVAERPNFHLALNYLGYMWAEHGENLEEALDLIERAVALEPDNGAYVDSLGWVYFRLGRHQEARAELERAASLLPEDATILEHLGDVLRVLGELAEAREVYRRAIRLDPGSPALRGKLEALDEQLGDGTGR